MTYSDRRSAEDRQSGAIYVPLDQRLERIEREQRITRNLVYGLYAIALAENGPTILNLLNDLSRIGATAAMIMQRIKP